MKHKDFKLPIIRRFLIIFLPLVVIITLGSYAVYYFHTVKSQQAVVKQREISLLQFQSEFVKNEIKSIVTDLRVIASDPVVEDLIESGLQPDEPMTATMLMAFSRYKGVYDQIRLLNETGMEILRINLRKDHPHNVPVSELQFKGKRYYFKDTFQLSKNQVFISPFDLNIEHGKIELPLKPMIRIGMPVYDKHNKKRGVILLNYLGCQILNQLEAHHQNMPGSLIFLNNDGYWLKGLTDEDEWGFMYEEKKANSFKIRYPEEWELISSTDTGQFLTSKGLYTHSTVYPLQQGTISSTGSHISDRESSGYLLQREYYWKIVSFMPIATLYADSRRFLSLLVKSDIVMFLLLGFMSWRFAETSTRKRIAEFALRKSHAELELIVNERTARLVEVNEALKNRIVEHQNTIKEKDEMAGQLRQAQKMEAIGTLAGGIAHDFNNILSIILGYAELARDLMASENKMASHIDEIMRAGNRAKELVKQILTFSRQTDKELKPLKISLIIKEAVKLLRASIPSTIEFQESIDPVSGMVLADVTHIHQIIMNLCTNAYHSMIKTGGVLTITSKPIVVKKESAHEYDLHLTPGEFVLLEVGDTGCGMDKKTLNRIFDPYFTTKKIGEGTGLGLSVVHGIIKSYDGHITVKSEPEVGTTFCLYFPRVVLGTISETKRKETLYPRGSEKIMLIEDEESILSVERQMLESLGYHITPFSDAVKALNTFQNMSEEFDIIITDMTMPHMTGAEVSQRILSIRPAIPVILCTGFSNQINEEKAAALGIHGFIMKPIIKIELANMVRNVLDSHQHNLKHFSFPEDPFRPIN
jgi:signal transduction histidine kinase/CheY-like chemotaxis protein